MDSTAKRLVELLRDNEPELRRRGVAHAAIFGSFARGDASPSSDVDIMVDIDPMRPMGVYEFVGIGCFLEDVFRRHVDIVERKVVVNRLGPGIERETVRAF